MLALARHHPQLVLVSASLGGRPGLAQRHANHVTRVTNINGTLPSGC